MSKIHSINEADMETVLMSGARVEYARISPDGTITIADGAVVISPDGTTRVRDGADPNEAARAFWQMVELLRFEGIKRGVYAQTRKYAEFLTPDAARVPFEVLDVDAAKEAK